MIKTADQGPGSEREFIRAARIAVLTAAAFLGGVVSTAPAQQTQQSQQSTQPAKKAVPGVHYKPHSKKVESIIGGYTVEMTSQPISHDADLGGGMTEKMLLLDSTKGLYAISHVDLKVPAANLKDVRSALKKFVKGMRKGVAIENEMDLLLGHRDVRGLEYECEERKGVYIRERVYIDGTRLHRVWVVSKERSFLRSAEAQRFFNSFSLIEARPKAEQPEKPVDWSIF